MSAIHVVGVQVMHLGVCGPQEFIDGVGEGVFLAVESPDHVVLLILAFLRFV
jgi:hypothetical protein